MAKWENVENIPTMVREMESLFMNAEVECSKVAYELPQNTRYLSLNELSV